MSAWLKSLDNKTRVAELFIDEEADLASCPDLHGAGTGTLSTVNGIAQGSIAILTTSGDTFYRLKGDNSWIKITIGGGGGGGGTTDYNQLTNKPSVNGVELSGNKTSDDLDVSPESRIEGEQLIFDQNQFGFGI